MPSAQQTVNLTLDAFIGAATSLGLNPKPRQGGRYFLLRCPNPRHNDQNPSATVTTKGDQVVLTCHSACSSANLAPDAREEWWHECLTGLGLDYQNGMGPQPALIRLATH